MRLIRLIKTIFDGANVLILHNNKRNVIFVRLAKFVNINAMKGQPD